MTTDLSIWTPPEKELLDKQSQYCQVLEKRSDQAILELIDEHRDGLMRDQVRISKKFMEKISEDIDGPELEELSGQERRRALRSYAETLKIVSDVQKTACLFDHVSKPKPAEESNARVSLFLQCAPIRVSENPCIDVQARES